MDSKTRKNLIKIVDNGKHKISITALSIPLNILGMECKGLGDKRITISNTLKQEYYGKV